MRSELLNPSTPRAYHSGTILWKKINFPSLISVQSFLIHSTMNHVYKYFYSTQDLTTAVGWDEEKKSGGWKMNGMGRAKKKIKNVLGHCRHNSSLPFITLSWEYLFLIAVALFQMQISLVVWTCYPRNKLAGCFKARWVLMISLAISIISPLGRWEGMRTPYLVGAEKVRVGSLI